MEEEYGKYEWEVRKCNKCRKCKCKETEYEKLGREAFKEIIVQFKKEEYE